VAGLRPSERRSLRLSGIFSVFLRTVRDAVDYEVDPSIGPAGYRIRGSPKE